MDSYQHRQFDVLLHSTADRFAGRITRRVDSPTVALARLRDEPEGEGVWLREFVDAVFAEFRLDDVAGAAFVLQALRKRLVTTEETVSDMLLRLAKDVFAELLTAKTVEALTQPDRFALKGTAEE